MERLKYRLEELSQLNDETIGAFFNIYYSKKIKEWVLRVSYDFVFKDKDLLNCVIMANEYIKKYRKLVKTKVYTLLEN